MAFVGFIHSRIAMVIQITLYDATNCSPSSGHSQIQSVEACAYTSMALHGQACLSLLTGRFLLLSGNCQSGGVPVTCSPPIVTFRFSACLHSGWQPLCSPHASCLMLPVARPLIRSGSACAFVLAGGPRATVRALPSAP